MHGHELKRSTDGTRCVRPSPAFVVPIADGTDRSATRVGVAAHGNGRARPRLVPEMVCFETGTVALGSARATNRGHLIVNRHLRSLGRGPRHAEADAALVEDSRWLGRIVAELAA